MTEWESPWFKVGRPQEAPMIGADPLQSLLHIPGHKEGVPVSGADESVVLLCAEVERLRAENDRLRAALALIAAAERLRAEVDEDDA